MKKALTIFLVVLLILFNFRSLFPIKKLLKRSFLTSPLVQTPQDNSIFWFRNYKEAIALAKKQKKYVALFFTGSDWCPWCKKMQNEILEDTGFVQKAASQFIFCKIDYPTKYRLSLFEEKQNQELKTKYHVENYPMLLLVDFQEMVISKMGYLPLEGKYYAKEMIKKIKNFQMLQSVEWDKISAQKMLKLYEMAKEIGCDFFIDKIFYLGMQKQESVHFLLEKYQQYLQKEKKEKAFAIKREIISRDPMNIHKAQLQLAIIDFHHLAKQDEKEDVAIQPLLSYINEYGKQDKESIWRLEMMICHFLSLKGNNEKALDHARLAFKVAPHIIKKEIAATITALKEQLEN